MRTFSFDRVIHFCEDDTGDTAIRLIKIRHLTNRNSRDRHRFCSTWGGERIGGRVLVWFADPAPVPAVQHLALLLVFFRFPCSFSFRFVSFRFASSLSMVALLALLVQIQINSMKRYQIPTLWYPSLVYELPRAVVCDHSRPRGVSRPYR